MCCSVLQRVAVCCSVLQRVAVCCRVSFLASKQVFWVLRRVAVGSSALQCAAVCGSVLQSVAQCCRVFLVVLKKRVRARGKLCMGWVCG